MSHAGRGRVLLQCSETLRIRGGYKWSFENKLKWTLVKSCKNHKFPSVAAILLASQRQRVPEKNLFPDCLGDPNTGWSKVHRLIRECRVLSVCLLPASDRLILHFPECYQVQISMCLRNDFSTLMKSWLWRKHSFNLSPEKQVGSWRFAFEAGKSRGRGY